MYRCFLFWIAILLGDEAAAQTLSVCQVLQHPEKYRDRVVSIRGIWVSGMEASYLAPISQKCSGRKPSGAGWAIWVSAPSLETMDGEQRQRLEQAEEKTFGPIARRLTDARLSGHTVVITLRGTFIAAGYGSARGMAGEGHSNMFAAKIVATKYESLEIEPKSR